MTNSETRLEVIHVPPGYESLGKVFAAALAQAASGKGHERHANGLPFDKQRMHTINQEQGTIDGYLFQARKKALESRGMVFGKAQAELLGAINYLAGAVIAYDTWAAGTLVPAPAFKVPDGCRVARWHDVEDEEERYVDKTRSASID